MPFQPKQLHQSYLSIPSATQNFKHLTACLATNGVHFEHLQ